MVIVAVKKKCLKNGKEYGPYPRDPEIWYLYRIYRDGDQIKQEYLGKGPKPREAVMRELRDQHREDLKRQLRYLSHLEGVVQEQ